METKTWNGHAWTVEALSDTRYSICCLDPDRDVNGTDCTEWPTDAILSDWCGVEIESGEAGDDPDHPEWIAHVREDR